MNDKEFLLAVRSYIEQSEVELDTHLGDHRNLKEMIAKGIMPELYAEVLRRIAARQGDSTP